jgi:hypothetical protein
VRRLLSLLFIVVLAARSLVPAGFMLQAPAGDDFVQLVICTGYGAQTITLDRDGTPVQPKPVKPETGLCPYAASAPVALVGDAPLSVSAPLQVASVDFPMTGGVGHVGPYFDGTSARGPPQNAV